MNRVTNTKNPTPLETYYLELDSRYHKGFRLRTSKMQGEPYRYNWEINPFGGFTLEDDIGNHITVTSGSKKIHIRNAAGSETIIEGSNITHRAKTITLDGDTTITKTLTVKNNTKLNADLNVGGSTVIGNTLATGGPASFPVHGRH
jgi:hypothetical protein